MADFTGDGTANDIYVLNHPRLLTTTRWVGGGNELLLNTGEGNAVDMFVSVAAGAAVSSTGTGSYSNAAVVGDFAGTGVSNVIYILTTGCSNSISECSGNGLDQLLLPVYTSVVVGTELPSSYGVGSGHFSLTTSLTSRTDNSRGAVVGAFAGVNGDPADVYIVNANQKNELLISDTEAGGDTEGGFTAVDNHFADSLNLVVDEDCSYAAVVGEFSGVEGIKNDIYVINGYSCVLASTLDFGVTPGTCTAADKYVTCTYVPGNFADTSGVSTQTIPTTSILRDVL